MAELRIAPKFTLGDDFVTKTAAIVAQRRKGKTYTANVIAEELVAAGLPWVALDPTGAWWGMRASADGKAAGLPVIVLGGQHGDAPLERLSGRVVAELVVEHPGWYVLDLSLFESKAAEREFSADFAEALYRRKGQPNRDFPLHLFVDEADMFVPQDRETGDARMLGAFQSIVRRGGLRGLGTTLISQRPALVNKSVLVQLDMLIVLRLVAGNDQDYVKKNYFERAGTKDQVTELMASMARLALGEAWVWEPGEDIFERIQVRERRTFNSSITPKPGEKRIEPNHLAVVDLDAVKDVMATAIQKAKADDPRELRKRISELERQNRELATATSAPTPAPEPEIIEVPAVTDEQMAALRDAISGCEGFAGVLTNAMETLVNVADGIASALYENGHHDRQDVPRARRAGDGARPVGDKTRVDRAAAVRERTDGRRPVPTEDRSAQRPDPPQRREPRSATVPRPATGDVDLGKGERAVLIVIAQFRSVTREQLTVMLGYKRSSRNTYIQRLVAAGLVTAPPGDRVHITDAGLDYLGDNYEPLPTGPALQDFWLDKLTGGEKVILAILINHYPLWMERSDLDDPTGYQRSSRNTYLQRLRSRELIDIDGSAVRASAILFE